MKGSIRKAGLIAIGLSLGCTPHEGGQVSDTATNWLGDCRSSEDCSGGASCIDAACVFACGVPEQRACESIDPEARCSLVSPVLARCDLPCTQDADCGLVAADEQRCRQGYCWPGIMIPAVSRREVEAPVSRPEPGAEPAEPVSLPERERVSMSLDPTQVMTLGDTSRQSSRPYVAWRGSEWQVTWTSAEIALDDSAVEPLVLAASVRPDGAVERRGASFSVRTFDALQEGPGGVFALLRPAAVLGNQLQPCEIAITDTNAMTSLPALRFSCGGDFAAAPIADSEDWLVLFSPPVQGQRGHQSDSLWLARYRPSAQNWVAGPWNVVSDEPRGALALGTLHDDALVVWHGSSRTHIARVQGVAAITPAEPADQPAQLEAFYTAEGALYALIETGQGALLLWPDVDTGLSASSIGADAGASPPVSVAPTSVYDRTPGVAHIPERAWTAVCYSTRERSGSGDGDSVSLAILDDDGVMLGAPSVVARSIENVGGCDLDWSGSALLVAWWEIDNDTPRVAAPSSIVRARIVALP